MPYKKGDEFVIKITDVMTGENGKTVYRMNDFNSLVFDEGGLDRLEKKEADEPEKKNPFKRVECGVPYYYITSYGISKNFIEDQDDIDDRHFSIANYCTDKFLMEQRALHETLNRLLWRYSEEHGGDSEWNGTNHHWFIYKNERDGLIEVCLNDAANTFGTPYFHSKGDAMGAIRDIVDPFMREHPEFVW